MSNWCRPIFISIEFDSRNSAQLSNGKFYHKHLDEFQDNALNWPFLRNRVFLHAGMAPDVTSSRHAAQDI